MYMCIYVVSLNRKTCKSKVYVNQLIKMLATIVSRNLNLHFLYSDCSSPRNSLFMVILPNITTENNDNINKSIRKTDRDSAK